MRKVKYIWLAFALMLVNLACSCSSSLNDDGNDDEPQVVLSDISGTWTEYAYKCSDGYFVDISGTGCVYEFARPDAFTKYQIKDGEKEILTQGKWTYNPGTRTAEIKEPRGWDLTIKFDFAVNENATLYIIGKTANQNQTIKVKRTSK
jgi:hypothetical protein